MKPRWLYLSLRQGRALESLAVLPSEPPLALDMGRLSLPARILLGEGFWEMLEQVGRPKKRSGEGL